MDESEIQRKRRDNEEMATRRRASLLGYSYLDTRQFETTIPLVPDLLKVEEIKNAFIVPLQKGNDQRPYQFMITSQTPQSKISDLRKQYGSGGQSVDFFLISGSAYQAFLIRYDPPKEIVYDDITIAGEGDSETIAQVSKTLDEVPTEKVFDYLLDQADRLVASDIHIENLRDRIRIRMRVDGILHPVADISRERYRIFMGELSSRANISTAATTPQSGHMQKDVYVDGRPHLLNIRVEMVPTM